MLNYLFPDRRGGLLSTEQLPDDISLGFNNILRCIVPGNGGCLIGLLFSAFYGKSRGFWV